MEILLYIYVYRYLSKKNEVYFGRDLFDTIVNVDSNAGCIDPINGVPNLFHEAIQSVYNVLCLEDPWSTWDLCTSCTCMYITNLGRVILQYVCRSVSLRRRRRSSMDRHICSWIGIYAHAYISFIQLHIYFSLDKVNMIYS